MLLISHRGNIHGPDRMKENTPEYIMESINQGYEVEVDVWSIDDEWFLGHDKPAVKIKDDFFSNKMWIHCKNLEAVEKLSGTNLNWFWHDKDKLTMTNGGFIWCHSGVFVENGIVVECGEPFKINKKIMGICTDYPAKWKNLID